MHETGDLLADLSPQRTAAWRRSTGTRHGCELCIQLLDAGLGQSQLRRLGPIEGYAEKGAARTTLLTDIQRRCLHAACHGGLGSAHYFGASGHRPVTGPNASAPGITLTTL